MQTEFEFNLPKGYLDEAGTIHQTGVMRLATAMDEIVPLQDPRVKMNPAYSTVVILSRVILKLGALEEITPRIVERFFACDLSYLQTFYRQINELEDPVQPGSIGPEQAGSKPIGLEPANPAPGSAAPTEAMS